MRTVEVLFVIMILLTSFTIATQFAVLPSATEAFGTNLDELAQSTLETLDAKNVLSATVFNDDDDVSWSALQKALSASLPVNVVYNLTVYDLSEDSGVITYQLNNSRSDTVFGASSAAASVMVSSPDVTFTEDPEKVGESSGQNITLYILNCNDANGWWITGYTGQSLATDFYQLLSPYFSNTVLVNSTTELSSLLQGTLTEGTIQNAVVMNTFGECVPIPSVYATAYSGGYAEYFHFLGQRVRNYNWTWVSIVGYPCYYVSNTGYFSSWDDDNGWGIYGMEQIGQAGARAFLQGLAGYGYSYDTSSITSDVGVVQLSSEALDKCNYYGIYPALEQTASRAISTSIEGSYNLQRSSSATVFNLKSGYLAGATFRHQSGSGAFTAIGLTRIPDVRVAALGLLMYYNPTVYRSEFGASGTSRLVTLQLGQQGGS